MIDLLIWGGLLCFLVSVVNFTKAPIILLKVKINAPDWYTHFGVLTKWFIFTALSSGVGLLGIALKYGS